LRRVREIEGANITLNTILMRDNLESAFEMIEFAEKHTVKIVFLPYSSVKNGKRSHALPREILNQNLLRRLKDNSPKTVTNPEFIIKETDSFLDSGHQGECDAGNSFLWVLPDGRLRACLDYEISEANTLEEVRNFSSENYCNDCFLPCRSVPEAATTNNPFKLFKGTKELIDNLRS